jgi:hypothetical protein
MKRPICGPESLEEFLVLKKLNDEKGVGHEATKN